MFDELQGLEFDWFALDEVGHIAIFSTAGWGTIPESVGSEFVSHRFISQELELPHLGSLDVWNDFARYGLYVYDWQVWKGPYRREAVPLAAIDESLKQRVLALKKLPRFNFKFESTLVVSL